MRQILNSKQNILLSINNKVIHEFVIDDVVGFGATCIVYDAHYYDSNNCKHIVRIKECYPINLNITRDDNVNLNIPEINKGKFKVSLNRFEDTYKKNVDFQLNKELVNTTSIAQGLYTANGTKYIVQNYNNGTAYDKITDNSIHEVFKTALAISKTVHKYHKNGYLHLDIKPENILKIPETSELVILFDFDSIVFKSDIQNEVVKNIAYSEKWVAPEQVQGQFKLICEATDIYAIGSIVFSRIMNRPVEVNDRRIFADWNFNKSDKIFEGCNSKIFNILTDFFHKTLSSSVKYRYQCIEELEDILKILLDYSSYNNVFLKSNISNSESYFVGRKKELSLIKEQLLGSINTVFLHGIGGIGKSQLVKEFAKENKDNFETIIFADFTGTLKSLIISDMEIPIVNFTRFEDENDDEYYERKMRKLSDIVNEKTLIIIDNFDVDQDENLYDLLKCNCKFLFTTRNDFSSYDFNVIDINEIDDISLLKKIFSHYYKRKYSEDDENIIISLINMVYGHTMTVELLAKQMMASRIHPKDMIDKLECYGINNTGNESIKHNKDNKLMNKSMHEHIYALFDLSNISDGKEYILMNLLLIPHTGINIEEFYDWCSLNSYEDINELINSGWIKFNEETDVIAFHPVIAEVIKEKIGVKEEKCKEFIEKEIHFMDVENESTCSDRMLKLIYGEHLIKHIVNSNDLKYEIYFKLSDILRTNGNYAKALEYAKIVLDILKMDSKGNGSADIVTLYNYMGNLYCESAQYKEAIEMLEKAKEIRKQYFKDEQEEIAENINDIGYLYAIMDDVEKAIELHLEALEIYTSLYGKNHWKIATVYNNIGYAYGKSGNYQKTLEYYLIALSSATEAFEKNKYNIALFNGNIGTAYSYLEEYEMALKYQMEALELRKSLYGENHPDIALTYNEIGQVYIDLKEYEQALQYVNKAIEISENISGENHPDTANSYCTLGLIYLIEKKYDKTMKCLEKELSIKRYIYGDEHSQVAAVYKNIAKVKSVQEEYKIAHEYYEKAEKIMINISNANYRKMYTLYEAMGENYENLQEKSKAIEYYQKASNIALKNGMEEKVELIKEKIEKI